MDQKDDDDNDDDDTVMKEQPTLDMSRSRLSGIKSAAPPSREPTSPRDSKAERKRGQPCRSFCMAFFDVI